MTLTASNPGSSFPGSIEIDGVTLYEEDGEINSWRYIPGEPVPEKSGSRPTLHLYVSAAGGILQLGTQWTVEPRLIEKLKREIADSAQREEAELQLQPAPGSVKQVAVEIGDGKGLSLAVGTSSSSGFPPYNAIFRITLDNEKKNAVVAALNGRSGFLAVRYRASVSQKVSARAILEGDVREADETLTSSATREEIVEWINASIERGRLNLSVQGIGEADSSLLSKAKEGVLERFAMILQGRLGQAERMRADESLLRVEVVESQLVEKSLERIADVSEWFGPGEGQKHITVLPGGDLGPQPMPSEVRVGLGFPAVDLPVAFVEARSMDKKALLRPPDFTPVVIPATGSTLQLTTHYTAGHAPYKTQVEVNDSERLQPADLGLTQILIDGTGRRNAGVKEILLHLSFLPASQGTPEDRNFHFHEQQWLASFYTATGGQPIAGDFELEWTEMSAAQEQSRRHFRAKDRTVFVLAEIETKQEN
jgi:hypothetical protein